MMGEVNAVVSTSSSLAGRPGQKGSPSRETEQEEQLGQSRQQAVGGRPAAWQPAVPGTGGMVPSLGRRGSLLFLSPWEQVTAAAGPCVPPRAHHTQGLRQLAACCQDSCCPPCSAGLGLLVAPSSNPWLPGSGATSQRPGIRERKEKVIQLPPGYVLYLLD